MLQIRPTFSESWYRVVSLKPKLRGTAQVSRQYYRGERWYVVRDAASNQFHRLSDTAYRFIGLLDGTRTVGEAWDLVGGQLADDAPTQPEVIQILSQLYAANLVETDIPPDATVLLRRHKKQMKRKMQGRMMNILFPRIPIWDPDRFLCRWLPLARIAFSKIGAIAWIGLILAAIYFLVPQWQEMKVAAGKSIEPKNWFYLWAVFVLIKFIHECGHAFACRRFGGEVHEMGIMFLVFIPTPYVDASTAWAFPNKWARMFVGAAGMIVELFVAAICAIIWANINHDTLTAKLLYNTMLIASVSTVLFNANPLLRYDGYYMLSDYLEIADLQMRSREYLFGLIKRHVFRIKPTQPLPPPLQRTQLFVYGLLSSVYRIFIGVIIILMVTWQVPILGVLMALGGVMTWLVVPVVKLFKYLTIDPELHRKRGRGWAFTLAVAAAVIVLIGFIRFPLSVYARGVVEPNEKFVLHTRTPGWVKEIKAKDGQRLAKDQVILVCEDPELNANIQRLEADVGELDARITQLAVENPAQMRLTREERDTKQGQLDDVLRQRDELTIKAPIDGTLISPELRHLQGRYLDRGTEIAIVATMETLKVKATIDQNDWELVTRENASLEKVFERAEIRLVGKPGQVLYPIPDKDGSVIKLTPAAEQELPHARLSAQGGGDVQTDPSDPKGVTPLVPQPGLRAIFPNPQGTYYAGQGAAIRLILENEALFHRWHRGFLQLVRSSSNSSRWI